METYRFFTVDEAGDVLGDRRIECTDDAEARDVARHLVTDVCSVEIWDVGRRVASISALARV